MTKQPNIEPVKLMCGILYNREEPFIAALEMLENKFGPVEFESERFPFSHSDYYTKEMGPDLTRCFLSFEDLTMPDKLAEAKQTAIKLEEKFLNEQGGRLVNVDPGLVGLGNLVLASTKEYAHRVYLGEGIFGEVSMIFEDKKFIPLAWTYPDYRRQETLRFLGRVRNRLKEQIIQLRQEKR
jgi:hypothetical protein